MSRYATFPTDYPLELNAQGKRDKARAFLEYCLDLDSDIHNTGTFYARGWNVTRKTACIWVKDFEEAITPIYNHMKEKIILLLQNITFNQTVNLENLSEYIIASVWGALSLSPTQSSKEKYLCTVSFLISYLHSIKK